MVREARSSRLMTTFNNEGSWDGAEIVREDSDGREIARQAGR